jgi:hypothetical protein
MPRTFADALAAPARKQYDGPQPAKVLRVVGSSLYVTLDAAPTLEVGPVRWSQPAAHTHTLSGGGSTDSYTPPAPPVGTRLLVQFAGSGIAQPWAVAWDGWPA